MTKQQRRKNRKKKQAERNKRRQELAGLGGYAQSTLDRIATDAEFRATKAGQRIMAGIRAAAFQGIGKQGIAELIKAELPAPEGE